MLSKDSPELARSKKIRRLVVLDDSSTEAELLLLDFVVPKNGIAARPLGA